MSPFSGSSFTVNPQYDLTPYLQQFGMPSSTPTSVAGLPAFGSPSTVPQTNGLANWFKDGDNIAAVAGVLGSLNSIYSGNKQLKLAREGLDFQKTAFNTNLNNSIQSYNTALEDRIRGRTSDYAGKDMDVSAYLAANSLRRSG